MKISILNFAKEKLLYYFNNNEKYIRWGVNNDEPQTLYSFYDNVVEHSSAINFISNNLIYTDIENIDYWTLLKITLDYLIFGGYSVEVVKQRGGGSIIKYKDIAKMRFNPDKTKIGYSENWQKYKTDVEWFDITTSNSKSGIFLFFNPKSRGDYPRPYYRSAAINLDTMKAIIDYHNNNANHGFTPSVIININSGEPDETEKARIEKRIEEKFTGTTGKKFLIVYNDNKDDAVTIEKLDSDNLDEKFKDLQQFIQEQIFIAHQITSASLIGKLNQNSGFSKLEYEESMSIFTENVIKPIRRELDYSLSLLLNKEIKIQSPIV